MANQTPADDQPEYLTRRLGAERLRRRYHRGSVAFLAKAAVAGSGPPFHLVGNTALYPSVPFDQWAEARLGAPRTEAAHRRSPKSADSHG